MAKKKAKAAGAGAWARSPDPERQPPFTCHLLGDLTALIERRV